MQGEHKSDSSLGDQSIDHKREERMAILRELEGHFVWLLNDARSRERLDTSDHARHNTAAFVRALDLVRGFIAEPWPGPAEADGLHAAPEDTDE